MRHPSGRARHWLLSFLTSARLLSATARVAAGAAIIAAPVVVGCSNEYDVTTEEGLKKALEEGKVMKKAVDQLKDVKPEQFKVIGPALQKRFIEGAPGFDAQIFQRIAQQRSPEYLETYIHALKSKDPELIRAAASVVGDLALTAAEEALAYAFDNTSDPSLRQTLIEEGRKAKSPLMADRAANLLKSGSIDNLPLPLLSAVCKTLEVTPHPEVIDKIIPLIFLKSTSGRTINAECTTTIQSYGAAAYPALLDVAQRKNKTVEHMIRRKGYRLSREEVLLSLTDVLLGLGHKDTPQVLLTLLNDPVAIREPAFIANNPNATSTEINDWNTTLMVGTQQAIQVLNRIGVQSQPDKVRDTLLNILSWNLTFRYKYRVVAGALLFEPIIRGEAARALAENDLLTEQHLTELLAIIRNPAWESNEDIRFRRTLLTGNLLIYLTIAGIPGVPPKVLYEELTTILQTDLAYNAYGKLADVSYCVDLITNPPEDAPPPAANNPIKSEADCYEQNVKDLNLLLKGEPVVIAPPPELKGKQLEAWLADPLRNAYKNLRAASLAMLEKCQSDADRLACYKTGFDEYQKLALLAFPKLPSGVYAEIQIPAMQIEQAKIALDTTTRCDAESDKLGCYKLTMDTNKAEPESGAFIRSVYALGKSGKSEYFPAVMAAYRAQYDSAQYMGNALYRLAAPEHLPLIEEVIIAPNSQVNPPERRTGQNLLMIAQMSYLKYHILNRAKGGQ
jgi:hypothetical protein